VSVQLPSLREIHFLAGLPGVRGTIGYPLRETSADPGIFGPDSVTWRVLGTPLLVLGGTRALLMQIANPLIAQGVIDHSKMDTDPFGRLVNTAEWVATVAFGTAVEAERAMRGLKAAHRRVTGTLPEANATAAYPAGSAYDASEPDLMRWVHATLVDSFLVAYETLSNRLAAADANRFVREWNVVAEGLGVPAASLWSTREDLRAYIDSEIASGRVSPGEGSRAVAGSILESPVRAEPLRSAWPMLHLFSTGLLADRLRQDFGLEWGPSQRFAHRALVRTLRGLVRVSPPPLRRAGVAAYAARRSRGDFAGFDKN
jgi:uncharacterized protein (DUF2236 family)